MALSRHVIPDNSLLPPHLTTDLARSMWETKSLVEQSSEAEGGLGPKGSVLVNGLTD